MADELDRRAGLAPEAFPERRAGDPRRAHPRLRVSLTALGYAHRNLVYFEVVDLSAGGMLVAGPRAHGLGARVLVNIDIPGSDRPVETSATVSSTRDDGDGRALLGLRFEEMEPSDARVVDAYVERLARQR